LCKQEGRIGGVRQPGTGVFWSYFIVDDGEPLRASLVTRFANPIELCGDLGSDNVGTLMRSVEVIALTNHPSFQRGHKSAPLLL
jgi:hypothetical protein